MHPMQQRMLDILGDQNPMDVIAQTPFEIGRIASAYSDEELTSHPYADRWTWTPNEIVGHLIDHETVMASRLRFVLFGDEPLLSGYDQEQWVRRQCYQEQEPAGLALMFQALRSLNLSTWGRIHGEDWDRRGTHAERGAESLKFMLKMNAGHDLWHLRQIRSYLNAICADAAEPIEPNSIPFPTGDSDEVEDNQC